VLQITTARASATSTGTWECAKVESQYLGGQIFTEHDFYSQLATALDARSCYGHSLDRCGIYSAQVRGEPLNSCGAMPLNRERQIGEHFDKIVAVLDRVPLSC
jgi:hypothetical protein